MKPLISVIYATDQFLSKAVMDIFLKQLIMVALCNRADHYIFCPVISIFLLSFFFLFFLA